MTDPSPFVLLGTLFLALAAAAGQVLRGDPGMLRRVVNGFDGGRRATGHGAGGGGGSSATSLAADPPRATVPDWSTSYDRAAGNGQSPQWDAAHDQAGSRLMETRDAASKLAGQSSNGLGGHAGGADRLAKGLSAGLEGGHAGGSAPGLGHDVAAQAGGHGGSLQADALGQDSPRPTDWRTDGPSPSDAPAQGPASGSLSGGGSPGGGSGGGHLAKLPPTSGADLAHGSLGGSAGGHASAGGSGPTGDGFAKVGGSGNGLAQTPSFPGDPGAVSGTGSSHIMSAGEAELADKLDLLSRSLASTDGITHPDAGTAARSDGAFSSTTGLGPSWLGAGALARAQHAEPLPKTYRCPSCGRTLNYGHRYCGYCGEPLEKTLA